MIDLGEDHPRYVASSLLSKKIKKFHDDSAALLPFLRECTTFAEVNTDQEEDKTMSSIYRIIEPCVINIRKGNNGDL